MSNVIFIQPDGSRQAVPARAGDCVLDLALEAGVSGLLGQCGGGCTCCTCHCWIRPDARNHLAPLHPDEVELLAYAWGRNNDSRLACQVHVPESLATLEVHIPAEQA